MAFPTMNGLSAQRNAGMSGTSRATTANFNQASNQPLQAPPQGMTTEPPPDFNSPPTGGYGQGSDVRGPGVGTRPSGPSSVSGAYARGGMSAGLPRGPGSANVTLAGSNGVQSSIANTPTSGGVVAGLSSPSAVGPEQAPQFDPNDPRNAALAGYMAGS